MTISYEDYVTGQPIACRAGQDHLNGKLGGIVEIGEVTLTTEQFFQLAAYVLQSVDLMGPKDPRALFVRMVRNSIRTEGHNPGGTRIAL